MPFSHPWRRCALITGLALVLVCGALAVFVWLVPKYRRGGTEPIVEANPFLSSLSWHEQQVLEYLRKTEGPDVEVTEWGPHDMSGKSFDHIQQFADYYFPEGVPILRVCYAGKDMLFGVSRGKVAPVAKNDDGRNWIEAIRKRPALRFSDLSKIKISMPKGNTLPKNKYPQMPGVPARP